MIAVSCIEFQALGADSAGRNKNVQNTVFIGDQERPKGMRSRRIERLDSFSAQVRLGHGVTFYCEQPDPEKLEAEKDWIPKSNEVTRASHRNVEALGAGSDRAVEWESPPLFEGWGATNAAAPWAGLVGEVAARAVACSAVMSG